MTTAEKLVRLRKEKGLSQLQLAEEINVSRQAISRWEVGLAVPSREKLRALSELYNVSVDYLLSDKTAEDMQKVSKTEDEAKEKPSNHLRVGLKKQNEQLKQVCADTREMISNFKKETERLQKQKKLLIGVVNTLMEKCMGVTEETQDIQTKKSFFGRVKGLTWERWQRIINAVTALGATVQACNRTLKAQPKAVVERKKSIRVQLQEIKEKHGTRD